MIGLPTLSIIGISALVAYFCIGIGIYLHLPTRFTQHWPWYQIVIAWGGWVVLALFLFKLMADVHNDGFLDSFRSKNKKWRDETRGSGP